ncbi:hypothetical protein MIMGU_mgv1a022367mg [Erythranthe guttata]|uniref:Uncharacterized protein n=2 Tax=Erythranthe guttata TaxID=4155 RepID=A0A022RMG5_ERYGU|nr:hypothetical protein MIMGU_mgv1a022367mg [Erythranthe guttata]
MAESFLQIILEKLSSLIHDKFVSITGMAKEMKKLSRTLATIQVVLEDAEMKQLKNRAIREWLVKLNDIAYEIDDILDEYITKLSKPMHRNCTLDGFNRIKFRHQIGRRMKQVTKNIGEVNAERKMFSLQEMTIERPIDAATSTIRETGSILTESHEIYGRDADAKKIVDILVTQVKDNQEISVLPIIGVGGQGKTTLAQLVYNDQQVVDSFDKRIWLSVSDNFDLKTLLKAMIESGTTNASDLDNLDTLQRHMWKLMNNKRYLLVLDDVWNKDREKWSDLRKVLACGSTGSSIIVTTRLKEVADIMGTLPAHQLTQFSDEQCWMLLREHAFGQEKEEYPNLEAIGKQIVNKCDGVPMVAKALGGLLRYKREETEWICVKESEIWELPEEETLQCFAYCAVLPKDSRIKKEELIFMWMAHGYISSKGALEVEDVGNQVCDELVLRSLLQYVPDTNKTILIMHDLVHDLAESIMENKIPGVQVQRKVTSASNSKIRQVNLRKKLIAFPTSNQREMDMSFILNNFLRLRILDASMTGKNELSSAISHLKHLRHLNLSGTEIRTLPDSLCCLWNLHVLNLDECNKLEALPKKMRDLINLRHLYLENCQSLTEMPSKVGELTCLKTLSRFIVGRDRGNRLEELQYLNLGGKLELHHLQRVESTMDAKKANLAEKKNLRHLKLYWELYSNQENIDEEVLEALEPYPNLETLLIKGFRGRCFPIWMSNSTMKKVVRIDISFCESFMHLPRLGELPLLKTLLLSNVKVEYIIEIEEEFPSLESLYLWGLPNFKGLSKEQVMRSTEAFPNLEELDIGWFSSLALPPLSTSLKKLKNLKCGSLNLASLSKLETLTDLTVHFTNTCKCIAVETLQSLANLKKLEIWEADERSLPEDGMRALKSLTSLSINYCRKLMGCLPQGWLRHLTALEELDIFQCDGVVELPDEVRYLKFLTKVELKSLPKMVYLPKALQHLSSSLQLLSLNDLPQMSSLPEWLGDFTSLEELTISECPKVTSLPTRIRGMTNLQFILVMECSELERRCEREIGEDWHNIQHIPHLCIGH